MIKWRAALALISTFTQSMKVIHSAAIRRMIVSPNLVEQLFPADDPALWVEKNFSRPSAGFGSSSMIRM